MNTKMKSIIDNCLKVESELKLELIIAEGRQIELKFELISVVENQNRLKDLLSKQAAKILRYNTNVFNFSNNYKHYFWMFNIIN